MSKAIGSEEAPVQATTLGFFPKKDTLPEYALRVLVVIAAIFILGFTSGILLEAGLGSAPITTLSHGIAKFFGVENGVANILVNIPILLLALVLIRQKLGIGTLLIAVLIGVFLDFSVSLFNMSVIQAWSYPAKLLATLVATAVQAFGVCLYVSMDVGLGGLEAVIIYLVKRFSWSWSIAKIAFETVILTVGFLLGGAVGLGTVVSYILSSFLMQFYFKYTDRISVQIAAFSRKKA